MADRKNIGGGPRSGDAARVRKLEEALKKMIYIVEHDFRQPLAVMKNSVYILQAKVKALNVEDEKVVKYLGMLESEIVRANDMVKEIVASAREVVGHDALKTSEKYPRSSSQD